MRAKTAVIAKPMDRAGKLYQRRAVEALPLLVRQSRAEQTIYYDKLAAELAMPNRRNLNFVLGSIGTSLMQLSSIWGTEVPPLQAIVVNQKDEMPGPGFDDSIRDPTILKGLGKPARRRIVQRMLTDVYTYPRWEDVLRYFDIASPTPAAQPELLKRAAAFRGGGGEGEAHLLLKRHVASNPLVVGIRRQMRRTTMEYRLPSGDEVDVLFELPEMIVAVEVKSAAAPEEDLVRGVFQCVKYAAVLNAQMRAAGSTTDVQVILGLGGRQTPAVQRLANTLGVAVIEQIAPDLSKPAPPGRVLRLANVRST